MSEMPSFDQDEEAPRSMSSSCFPITLQFVDVCYRIKMAPMTAASASGGRLKRIFSSASSHVEQPPNVEERTILSGITGMVSPGEMLAILGPSGSGKSTLLRILAGHLQGCHSSAVLFNGHKPTRAMLRRTGFVPQDDVLYAHLTVRETLVFAALLRMPRTLSRAEKVAAAEAVVAELGLEKCAETMVGDGVFVRGVSGGERRRVSIGKEVLGNPSVLLLDEPTSGLDSTAAERVVAAVATAARTRGRAVVAAVHQPSSRTYREFDAVLLLSMEGRALYFGRGREAMDYFAAAGVVPRCTHVNPAEFMLDLANGVAQIETRGDVEKSNAKQYLVSSYNQLLAPKVKSCIIPAATRDAIQSGSQQKSTINDPKNYSRISWVSQFTILLHRSLKERRYETFNSLRVLQVVAAAVLSGFMWWRSNIHDVQDRLGLLFFISIFWGVFASFNAVFTFPQERVIFIKERSSGMYTLSSYFMARMVGDLPMELILPTVFTLVVYWMAGLRPELGSFMLTLTVLLGYVLVAQGLGLAVGAIIMDAKKASTVVTVTMLAFLLTGGFYVKNVPSCIGWMKYISFTFYCYRLLIGVQYKNRDGMVEGILGSQVSTLGCVMALVLMFFGYRLLAYAALRRIRA